MRTASPVAAAAIGHVPNPVRIELMRGIEVGGRAPLIGRECINDLTVEGEAVRLKAIHTFGVRSNIDRLRVDVVDVELQACSHGMPQRNLQAVVVAVASRLPAIE